jgi:hypothetical protein
LHIELAKSTSRRPRGGALNAITNFNNIIRFSCLFDRYLMFACYHTNYLFNVSCNHVDSNHLMVIFTLGVEGYRVIDKRANKTEGNADHENVGDEDDDEVWGEDEDGGNDNNGQLYYLIYL